MSHAAHTSCDQHDHGHSSSGLVGPTCCCASFLLSFDWREDWPGDATLRLKGGADGSTEAAKSTSKVVTVVYGLKSLIPVSENSPAGATALAVSEAGTILAIGSGCINQGVKAIATARGAAGA